VVKHRAGPDNHPDHKEIEMTAPTNVVQAAPTLADPKVREALQTLTGMQSEAMRSARGIRAVLDALEDDLASVDQDKHSKTWGLLDALNSGLVHLEASIDRAEKPCWFFTSEVLR
jgi:hypothetical protein